MDGCDRRVCVAVLVNRFGTRDQIDGGGYFANVANGVDRGTYRPAPIVSRKGAKGRNGFLFSSQPEAYQDSISHVSRQGAKKTVKV